MSTCLAQAQTTIVPEELTIADGLAQGYISSIHQDQEGFLWLGTKNGLNRYDGKQFELFTYDPLDAYALSSDWVLDIHEKGDFLILANDSEYLNLLHKKTKRFYRLSLQVKGMELPKEAVKIVEDESGDFWVQLQQPNQIVRLRFPEDFWNDFPKDTSLLSKVKVEFIAKAERLFQQDNEIFILQAGITHQIDIHTLDIASIVPAELATTVIDFHQITPQLAWIRTKQNTQEEGYQLFNLKNGKWQALHTDFKFTKYYFHNESSNLLWVQRYEDNEIFLFDLSTLESATHLQVSDAQYRIPNINAGLTAWHKDQSGIMWMGTGGLGLRKISPRKLAIKTYKSGFSVYNHLFSSADGEVLFHRFGTADFYKPGASAPLQNIFQLVKSTKVEHLYWLNAHAGSGWLLTQEKQVSQKQHEIKLYFYQNETLEELAQWTIADAQIDSKLHLIKGQQDHFLIVFANNLIQYDLQSKQSQIFTIDLLQEVKPTVFYAAQTANGDCWIGTTQGLVQAKKGQQGFDFRWVEGLRNPVCASVLTDPKDGNILWIGTKGGGLHQLDSRIMEFEYLNTKNGLPNDVIYSVLNDEEGNLWMSSNRGVIRYTPETGIIRNFTADDGMQSNEFNTYAFGKSPNGELLFGGINGLNVFHPNDLRDNPVAPKVSITGLEINNQAIRVSDSTNILGKAIEFTNSITLPYQQNSVSLTFAALEFSTPKKNQFSYYLEGAEAEWTHTTTDNRASYLNLSPGNYTFNIKAANGDQVWSETVQTLNITILPPWYRTTLAYLLYTLLIGLLAWWYIRFQRNRLQLKHSLELEQKEAERLKELDAFRSRLYTNITHEFRTPLTVILGTSEQLETQEFAKHPARKRLALIRRNGNNLLNLVNQMLDLSKLDHNELAVNYEQGDILAYLRYLTESFHSLADANNITLKVESKQTEIWMDYDAEKIRQILSNLLSNAIKYTSSGGQVVLTAQEQAHQIHISVRDTGKGIAEADLPSIFNRYYQANDDIAKAGGTGIGLALTYELVKLLGGEIQATSELGKGTTVTFWLPIHRKVPIKQHEHVAVSTITHPESTAINRTAPLKNLPKLLIVEDNRDVVEYLTACLQQQYDLIFAYNGQAGIEQALERTPDLIISDVMMPEKTGFELTDTLKKDERTSHIPIVLLTAKADIESKLAGLRRGADVYLPKPFYREELLVSLENLLSIRRKLQAKYQTLALATDTSEVANDQEALFLQKLRQLLEAALDDPNLKADDIAKQISMSRSNLYAKLTAVTGMSFNLYLRSLRLQKAKLLLTTTTLNISEIAYEVGFKTPSYFSTQFKKTFGYAPSEERGGV